MTLMRFFNKKVLVKRMPTTGKTRRFSSTATIDGNIQSDSRAEELMQANFGTIFKGFFDLNAPIREGFKIIEQLTGIEYIVESAEPQEHSHTGTAYLEVILRKESSKQDGKANYSS